MSKLADVMAYLMERQDGAQSNARLTKMVYLADWHQAINHGKQITPIKWYFDNYGPFVWDVYKESAAHPDLFAVKEEENVFGQVKKFIRLKSKPSRLDLTADEKKSLDHVIDNTSHLSWDYFIRLVYSTYPIVSSDRYSQLDLLKKAAEYKVS